MIQYRVRYLFGAYVDIHGVPKSKCVPIDHFADYVNGSELYTVGALEGMGSLGPNEDECIGIPDLSSLVVLPWDHRYALSAADLIWHGSPYSHDSRGALKRQVDAASEMGFTVNMGVEPELYVARDVDGRIEPFVPDDALNAPTRGYDLEATIQSDAFLEPMINYMNELGWDVYSFDHEGGDGQYEFNFSYCDVLGMCDQMLVFKLMAKHVARSLGCFATFMPKPWVDDFGSGAHMNISLADISSGLNTFDAGASSDLNDPLGRGYSDIAYKFTAGILRHAGAITALACPTVNSYKRLEPYGRMREMTWAPVYRAYGHNNRTLMCRMPANRRCLELRHADAGCNLYLVSALTVAAGLDGIRNDLDAGEPCEINTYDVTHESELADMGIRRLPRSLKDALDEFEQDDLARITLGAEFHRTFLEYKRGEWEEFNQAVTDWETQKYLRLW